ncbi:UNVERIFIED_CONTAM: hypothetical protein ACS92_06790 [Bacillus cereus]
MQEPVDAHLLARLELHLDVGRRVRTVANLDDHEPWRERRILCLEFFDFGRNGRTQLAADCSAVNDGHVCTRIFFFPRENRFGANCWPVWCEESGRCEE